MAYTLHGDPKTATHVVVYFAGLFGSRLEYFGRKPLDGICVVTVDRPGYGLTPFLPLPTRSYLQTGADVGALVASLGVSRFSVAGWSSGGPYALACAVANGAAVDNVVLVAADPPWGTVPADVPNRLHAVLLRLVRLRLARPVWTVLARLLAAHMAATRPALLAKVTEPVRGGVRGVADEMAMERGDWGFSLRDVRHNVTVVHGARDAMVPPAAARYLVRHLLATTHIPLPGLGHGVMRSLWDPLIRLAAEGSPASARAVLAAARAKAEEREHRARLRRALAAGTDAMGAEVDRHRAHVAALETAEADAAADAAATADAVAAAAERHTGAGASGTAGTTTVGADAATGAGAAAGVGAVEFRSRRGEE